MSSDRQTRRVVWALALGYTVFVVYGSLVPLEYRALPLSEALEQFRALPFLQLSLAKRADWVANGLLFFPLAFFWLLALGSLGVLSRLPRLVLALLVVLCLALLSVGIEFTQLFFPQRTVSQNDIMAETIGAVLGAAFWMVRGRRTLQALDRYLGAREAGEGWTLALLAYGLGFFLYSLMPLDLFLSPAELYAKWQDGRINLLPFAVLPEGFLAAAYAILTDIAVWVPVPLLLHRAGFCHRGGVVWVTVALAFALECAQLLVFSRFSDVTDLITAALGAALGAYLLRRLGLAGDRGAPMTLDVSGRLLLISLCLLGWVLLLLLAMWYPFNFDVTRATLRAAESRFLSVPFVSYYFTSEFRALTELLRKVLFMAPLGVLIGAAIDSVTAHRVQRAFRVILWPASALLVLGLELGQLFLPEKTGNVTDFLLGCVGLGLGAWVWRQLREAAQGNDGNGVSGGPVAREDPSRAPPATREPDALPMPVSGVALVIGLACLWLALTAAISVLTALPGLPYNVKELVDGPSRLLRAGGIALVLLWLFAVPGLYLDWRAGRRAGEPAPDWIRRIEGPGRLVLLQALVLCALALLVFPREAIHDVVGSPTWGILPGLERFWRFSGLACLICALLWFAAAMTGTRSTAAPASARRRRDAWRARAFLPAVLLSLLWAFVVVVLLAGTDNVVELLRYRGRSWRVALLALYLLLLFGCSLSLARLREASAGRWLVLLGLIVLSGPVGYGLLDAALENIIFKYDAVFTAMQFLLSADRENYLPVEALFGRFLLAHYGMLVGVVVLQVSLWMRLAGRLRRIA